MTEIRHMRPRTDVGEGSRGGKIIGHTASNKPIYEDHNHTGHKDFSSGEHREAVKVHEKAWKEIGKEFKSKGIPADRVSKLRDHSKGMEHHAAEASKKC